MPRLGAENTTNTNKRPSNTSITGGERERIYVQDALAGDVVDADVAALGVVGHHFDRLEDRHIRHVGPAAHVQVKAGDLHHADLAARYRTRRNRESIGWK